MSGKIDSDFTIKDSDFRRNVPFFKKENLKINKALVKLIEEIAAAKDTAPAQIALAWLLAQKPWIVPIPGTTKLERVKENIGAASIELSDQELADLDQALDKIEVAGTPYPEGSKYAERVGN